VTGVQTCALPIYLGKAQRTHPAALRGQKDLGTRGIRAHRAMGTDGRW